MSVEEALLAEEAVAEFVVAYFRVDFRVWPLVGGFFAFGLFLFGVLNYGRLQLAYGCYTVGRQELTLGLKRLDRNKFRR